MLFDKEEKILKSTLKICSDNKYKNNPLFEEYKNLADSYKKLINESKKIVNISDNLQNNLKETKEKLKKINDVKTEIMQITAHDLQSPISMISGFSEMMLKDNNLNEKNKNFINIIYKASRWMYQLISELLLDTMLEDESININIEKIDLYAFVKEIIDKNIPHAKQKKQKIIYVPFKEENLYIKSDSKFINEILNNLINNAIKYSQPGKSIWVKLNEINKKKNENWIQFHIKDEGPGFTIEDQKKIYNKFQRLSANPTANEPSIGLGLYITKKLVELLGGEILLESKPDKGSSFIVNLKEV